MDYKKIFRTRTARQKMLRIFNFVPDKTMVKWQYWIKTGRRLNLKNPDRFTEKIQWNKLYYRNPLMHQCVDKYAVREYVEKKVGAQYLNDCFGVYDRVEDIDFEALPERYAIKKTNGGGGLSVLFCKDKKTFDVDAAKQQMESWFHVIRSGGGREWAYRGVPTRIIIEEFLENTEDPENSINDYKIFCYQGKAKYIWVDVDRYILHKRNFYDLEWNNLHIESDHPMIEREIEKPKNLDEMIRVAEKISEDFPFCRVDLYNLSGKILFGEITFYPCSGYLQFTPDEWDYKLGEDLPLIEYKE